MKQLIYFLISYIAFIVIDIAWIGGIAKQWYVDHLGPIARMNNGNLEANIPAALIVWLLLVTGIWLFVLPHASSYGTALLWDALYGLIVYGVYDLTNYSVLAQWPLTVVFIDIAWGIAINSAISLISYYLLSK